MTVTDNLETGNAICAVVEKIYRLKQATLLSFSVRFSKDEDHIKNALLEVVESRIEETIEKIEHLKKVCGMYDREATDETQQ